MIQRLLLTKLKELNNIIPLILKDGIKIYGTQAKNAVISNSIINMLNRKRPDDNPLKRPRNNNNNSPPTKRLAWQAGTRKRRRKSKATRRRR